MYLEIIAGVGILAAVLALSGAYLILRRVKRQILEMSEVLEDVKAGKYMNCVDADGNFTGDQMAVNALLAKIGEAQMKAASRQTARYAWETSFTPNSTKGDSLAEAIAHISD